MEYEIKVDKDISFDDLNTAIEKGARFIVYRYCISIFFAISLSRLSPAFLVLKMQQDGLYKTKYNILTCIFGWWCIPWGISDSIKALRMNNSGGIDVTRDIMLNIDSAQFEQRKVQLKIVHDIFMKPTGADKKGFLKAAKTIRMEVNIRSVVVGLFVNTDKYTEPYYVVGIDGVSDFGSCIMIVQKALYKVFRKHVYFEFVDITHTDNADLWDKLLEQGEKIV